MNHATSITSGSYPFFGFRLQFRLTVDIPLSVFEHWDLLTGVLMSHLAFIFHHTLFTQPFQFAAEQLSRKKSRLLSVNSFAYIFLHDSTNNVSLINI